MKASELRALVPTRRAAFDKLVEIGCGTPMTSEERNGWTCGFHSAINLLIERGVIEDDQQED